MAFPCSTPNQIFAISFGIAALSANRVIRVVIGVALDYAVELVCKTYVIPIETLPYNISDGYPSSRLGLTSCMIVIFIEFYECFYCASLSVVLYLTISVYAIGLR